MYINNCSEHKQTVLDNFEPAELIENALTQTQIDELILLQFQTADRIKYTASSNNIQPVCDIDSVFAKCDWLKPIFTDLIGEFSNNHTGNYYITTSLHDAHVDLLSENECARPEFDWTKRVIPYKSCVIPLLITEKSDAVTAFFNQRHIGYSTTFDRVKISEQGNSEYEIARTYPKLYERDGTLSDSESVYKRKKDILFPQIPAGNMQGLSVEIVMPYRPGDIMLFDACQLHASGTRRNRPNYRWLKSGMNIQFYKEI
jgi:hypothetical protein